MCSKTDAQAMDGYDCQKTVIKYHDCEGATTARWMHRVRGREDPWISYYDHWDEDRGTILYGQNAWFNPGDGQHDRLQLNCNGLNVWIRKGPENRHLEFVRRPLPILHPIYSLQSVTVRMDFRGKTWFLVRRVSPSHTGNHPARDSLAGIATYGNVPCDSTDNATFSIYVGLWFDS